MLRYYWLVLCKAFHPSWAIAGIIGTLLGLFVPAIAKFVPEDWRERMAESVWEVPLSALLTLFIVRIVMAPWLIHKEQESKLADKTKEIADRDRLIEEERVSHQAKLHQERTADPSRNAIRQEVKRRLAAFEALEKDILADNKRAGSEVYRLEFRTHQYLTEHLREYPGFEGEYRIDTYCPTEHQVNMGDAKQRCQYRIERLREVLRIVG
jgi:hypothetical protein